MRLLSLLAGLAILGGCATTAPPAAAPPPPSPGMELLLGKGTETAISILGEAALDRREGIARQLQFAGACILDIFYYPAAGGLVARYAEARLPNGQSLPAGECFQSLSRARG